MKVRGKFVKCIIGCTEENNIFVQYGEFYIEMNGLACLESIKEVKEWDDAGYMVLDTNYGEEYYEINGFLERLFTKKEIKNRNLLKPLKGVEGFTISQDTPVMDAINYPKCIVDDFTIFKVKRKNQVYRSILVRDLHNSQYRMYLIFWTNKWEIFTSTFPPGERKYQVYHSINESFE